MPTRSFPRSCTRSFSTGAHANTWASHIRSYSDTRLDLAPGVAVCLLTRIPAIGDALRGALFRVRPIMRRPPLGQDGLTQNLHQTIDVGTRAPLRDRHQ